jgi:uncharacterized membrane protein YidH (DUF202 family)
MASLEPTVGKRIALPMRIEPKVYFANERTFLSWLHFTVVLGGLAMGLLNFGDKISQICALMFTLIAMGVMVYALYTYHWRANKIRNRLDASYDDRWGPSVLCVFLLAAVLVNLFCKFPDPSASHSFTNHLSYASHSAHKWKEESVEDIFIQKAKSLCFVYWVSQ